VSGLAWTSEKPTEPGWYWLKDGKEDVCPAEVLRLEANGILYVSEAHLDNLYTMACYRDALWCGPIPCPELPDDRS
jgi:hypothetical protein